MKPRFVIETHVAGNQQMNPESSCIFTFIPSYLTYIMTELLKNSCRASVEQCANQEELNQRPIQIIVCCDEGRVAIHVSDRAGGIPFDVGENIWSYLYSTVHASRRNMSLKKARMVQL